MHSTIPSRYRTEILIGACNLWRNTVRWDMLDVKNTSNRFEKRNIRNTESALNRIRSPLLLIFIRFVGSVNNHVPDSKRRWAKGCSNSLLTETSSTTFFSRLLPLMESNPFLYAWQIDAHNRDFLGISDVTGSFLEDVDCFRYLNMSPNYQEKDRFWLFLWFRVIVIL